MHPVHCQVSVFIPCRASHLLSSMPALALVVLLHTHINIRVEDGRWRCEL